MPPSLRGHRALFSPSGPPVFTSARSPSHISILNQITTRTYASPSSSKTHTRPSSSAQPESSSTVPSTSSTAATSLAHDVNPPPSTRPADISTPEPVGPEASAADKLKRYVALGRAYLSFYKTGLKNVYHNHRASLPLRRALGLPMYLPVSPPPSPRKAAAVSAFRAAIQSDPEFSRSHFQLVRRAAYDVRRIVPFSLMLIICGEFTPLIVLAVGSAIVPFTCRVPKQFAKDRAQRASRKRAALVDHFVRTTGSMSVPGSSSSSGSGTAGKNYGPELDLLATQFANREWIETASSEEILRTCAVMGLARTHRRSSALVSLVYKPRLQRFAEYLALDDGLIRRGGGVGAMEAVEVRIAVEERGGVELVMEMEDWEAEREQRRWLEAWLERREGLQL